MSQTRFNMVSKTIEDEKAYDYTGSRNVEHPVSMIVSVAHLMKGALGAGVMSSHYGYMKAGYLLALIGNVLLGLYLMYSLYIIVESAQTLCKRAQVPHMTYPDVGEAAMVQTGRPTLIKYAYLLRFTIDFTLMVELFGTCLTYHIIMARAIKQLVQLTNNTTSDPSLRLYILMVLIPCILICLIRDLAFIGKFSIVGVTLVFICILTTIYYASTINPQLKNLQPIGTTRGIFEMVGLLTWSMSCVGIVLPVENHMNNPKNYKFVHAIAYVFIIGFTVSTGFCGYVAFLDKCVAPITVNFPKNTYTLCLKCLLIIMIYFSHAINFWVPFSLLFVHIKRFHKNTSNVVRLELIYRGGLVVGLNVIAIINPGVEAIMGFLGAFAVGMVAFCIPHLVQILVYLPRPGYGPYKWRLWKSIFFLFIGINLFLVGSYFSCVSVIKAFSTNYS